MLHSRYALIKASGTQIKASGAITKIENTSMEISILQALSIHHKEEKDHVTEYLKYRDNGHMYFPCVELIPFLKAVDAITMKSCNDKSFEQHGSELLTVLCISVETNTSFRSLFANVVMTKLPELDINFSCLD